MPSMPGLRRWETTPDFGSVNFSKNFDVAGVLTAASESSALQIHMSAACPYGAPFTRGRAR